MPKILIASGPWGRNVRPWVTAHEWRWCDDNEPVGVHGMVCASACHCGCDRSFTGVDTAKATTEATVAEVSFDKLAEIKDRLETRVLAGWSGDKGIARGALHDFDVLVEALAIYPVGTKLKVKKGDGSFTLAPPNY